MGDVPGVSGQRVAVVVLLEASTDGGVSVDAKQARVGAMLAVLGALRAGAADVEGDSIFLEARYVNGKRTFFEVFGVDEVNVMFRERAVGVTVTDLLWEKEK